MNEWYWAIAFNLGFAIAAFLLGTVSRSGVAGGVVVGTVLYLIAGWQGWLLLVAFFVMGSGLSKLGYRRKAAMGVAQEDGGRRGSKHALANCGGALIFALLFYVTDSPLFLLAYVGAFATAVSDTSGSEIGQLYGKTPILITTFRRVPVGTDGAVSLEGTFAGIVASLILALVAFSIGFAPGAGVHILWIIAAAAFVGTTVESYVGAAFDQVKAIDNEVMNFSNTLVGGGAAALLGLLVL